MFKMKYVSDDDQSFWFTLDKHLHKNEFALKVRDKRGYIISDGKNPIGIMRYNLFWDNIPFLTLIYLDERYRGMGFGMNAVLHWENEMRLHGHKIVMTSTQVDEQAQHFYRKLGYKDSGCIVMNIAPFEQPLEMFFMKSLDTL